MTSKRGISLLDLINLPPGSQSLIPPDVAAQLERLAVLDHRSTTSQGAYIHYGTVQSLADMGLPALRNWPVEAPGLNAGLPFQLTLKRIAPSAGQNLEPAPQEFRLDLFLERVSIIVPGLRPASLVPASGVTAAHLVADLRRENVRIFGSGILRIASNPDGGPVIARFIDSPDPFDPDAPTGPVFTIGFDPPHFFVGGSDIGLTVDRLTYDDSEEFTPPEILARGQPASWRGIAIREATLYLPRNAPVVGDVSVGVRDVLLGSPFGLQGEVRIELGQTPVDPALVTFFQQIDGSDTPLPAPAGTGRSRTVTFAPGTTGPARVRGHLPSGADGLWQLPSDDWSAGATTRYFTARAGDTVIFTAVEEDEAGEPALSPEIAFTFQESTGPPQHAPRINVTVNGVTRNNVIYVSGAREALEDLVFQADPPSDTLTWQLGSGAVPASGRGASFEPAPPAETGRHTLVLRDAQGRERRVEIEVLEEGRLIIGAEAGAFDATGPVPMRSVEATYDLGTFHKEGRRAPSTAEATLADPNTIAVPEGALAEVALELGRPEDPDAPPDPESPDTSVRHVQVLMDFDDTTPLAWGEHRPVGAGAFSVDALREWAAGFTDARFVIIGRCDDLGSQAYNRNLANQRATQGRDLLTSSSRPGPTAPADHVFARGEQSTWNNPDGADAEADIDPPLTHEESVAAISDPGPDGWLIKRQLSDADRDGWPSEPVGPAEGVRRLYRRVDIYAVGGTPASGAPTEPRDEERLDPALRRTLIPGADATSIQPPAPREPDLPYRVRLIVRWDSPTVVEWADAIPTLAELTIAWQAEPVPVPGTSGDVTPVRDPSAPGPEIFTFVGRWSYDARSGQTIFSLALDSAGDPNGLFPLVDTSGSGAGNVLATALALGPALMAGIAAADIDGVAVRIGALIGASAAAAVFAKDGRVVVFGIQVEHRQRALDSLAGSRQRFLFDYSVEIGFDTGIVPVPIRIQAEKPIRVRYKNVGVEIDNARDGLDRLGIVYEDVSFEIEDPGQWRIDGPLGELLRVTGTRAGSGSTWYEIDLAFALDLGVITVTGATIRLTFNGGSIGIELRGLAAAVEIPNTLKGAGRLALGDGGAIRAGLDVEIIPAQIAARGALALQADVGFVAIEVGVIFAVGIPLGQSGLGIYGFIGRFVSNGTRDLTGTTLDDPVQREIDWYRKPPEQKYSPLPGQWALGLGAVVGTMPDTAFTFNALGMFTVEFPDPSVIFGIDAKLVSRPGLPSEQGSSPPPGTLLLLGIIAIDPTAVKLGVRGSYEIPRLLRLSVPVSGFFPIPPNPADAYIRIGADGFEGRTGDPVSVVFLPGTLDVTAWAFLMIEEKKLHRLGGDDRFNFDGFSIGYGSGWGIDWSAGPIRLTASAKVLVGVGTRPLMLVGGIFVRGELSLVVVSVSARGEILLKLLEDEQRLFGEFCGKVDMFFFSIEGCVGIDVGTDPGDDIPVPASPLLGIDLTDRRGIVTGRAVVGAPGEENTVWPDTVPVLHFAHYLRTALPADSAFHPSPEIPGLVWSGTSELKYAYRLVGVDIIPAGESPLAGPLDSAWWLPSYRPGVTEVGDAPASEHEGRDLALLSWHPAPWARNLGEGAEDTPGDPSNTVDRVCDPPPAPRKVCALGLNAQRINVDRVRLKPDRPSEPPFPSFFQILGRESFGPLDMEALSALAAAHGIHLEPGHVEPLPAPFTVPGHPDPLPAAYELPYLADRNWFLSTLQFDGQFAPAVVDPDLVLAVCVRGDETRGARQECDDFADIKPETRLPTVFTHGSLTYENLAPNFPMQTVDWIPAGASDGVSELQFSAKGLRVRLPSPTQVVTAHVAHFTGQPVELQAFNSRGDLVARTVGPIAGNTVHQLTVRGADIVEVVIAGGGNEGVLLKLCYAVAALEPLLADIPGFKRRDENQRLPQVIGIRSDGKAVEWNSEIIGRVTGDERHEVCAIVRYVPPGRGPWRAFRILPWSRFHIGILSSCAITWAAAEAHEEDQQARDLFVGIWNGRAADNTPARRHLLEPDTIYRVRVRWQWQGWRRTEDESEPPPIDDAAWSAPVEEIYSFRTAREVPLPPNPEPVDFIDESAFDPRGVARYLISFEPDGKGPPHFLDDPIRVHFSVDHLAQLLELYDRRLILKLRRTDPPAGTLHDVDRPPDIPFAIEWRPLMDELMPHSDRRMLEAARLAPCLDEPSLGGTTAEITADLEPNAGYDLLLVAPPTASPDADEILIARAHFRTSRYRNPAEMLEALGFTAPEPYPILPHDALVTASVPTSPANLGNDQALEQTLSDLGLDPWPLPDQPRAVTIWRNGATWDLVGVLLETDEPLDRTGVIVQDGRLTTGKRLSVGSTQAGTGDFAPVRSNAAWTRVLLAPTTAVTLAPEDVLSVTLTEPDGTVSGERRLVDRPRIAHQEGL